MWAWLQAVVEEQATALLRTAMSVIVREGGDLSCGIFDLRGRCAVPALVPGSALPRTFRLKPSRVCVLGHRAG